MRYTFLTSNLGFSCFELAVLGAGGSTSMGVDMIFFVATVNGEKRPEFRVAYSDSDHYR